MGKGTIISGGTGGQYQLQINYDQIAYDAELASLSLKITAYTIKIADFEAENKSITALVLAKLSFEKRKQYLENNMPKDKTISAWCADLTEDLTGFVGTVEIHGESTYTQIQPGHENSAIYDSARDGVLTPMISQTPMQAFYNLATMPGWQKWKPLFRYGTITAIDGDTASVTVEDIKSSQQSIEINQTETLTGVAIEYMSCNGSAFEIGDDVLIKFTSQDWESPVIIGFKDNPRACGWFLDLSTFVDVAPIYYPLVYDVDKDTVNVTISGNTPNLITATIISYPYRIISDSSNYIYIDFSAEVNPTDRGTLYIEVGFVSDTDQWLHQISIRRDAPNNYAGVDTKLQWLIPTGATGIFWVRVREINSIYGLGLNSVTISKIGTSANEKSDYTTILMPRLVFDTYRYSI